MKFKDSKLAHKYLDGLDLVVEIGAAAHNPFNIKSKRYLNVDVERSELYKQEQVKMCGEVAKVDVISAGDSLPFENASVDAILTSHVIEHFFDPIKTLKEWKRVLKPEGLMFIICPHKDRTFDKDKTLTDIPELILRNKGMLIQEDYPTNHPYGHWTIWNTTRFLEFLGHLGYRVVEVLDTDDKVGNGFCVVVKI